MRVLALDIILALDNLCLFRMKPKPAFSKTLIKRIFEDFRLRLTFAMAESVVREPFKKFTGCVVSMRIPLEPL
jgi:hypothetical protein